MSDAIRSFDVTREQIDVTRGPTRVYAVGMPRCTVELIDGSTWEIDGRLDVLSALSGAVDVSDATSTILALGGFRVDEQ